MKFKTSTKTKLINQLIAGNLIITFSVIIIMGILSISVSCKYIKRKFISHNEVLLEQTSTYLDSYFDRIFKMPLSINDQNQNINTLLEYAYEGNLTDFAPNFSDFLTMFADCDYIDNIWIYDGKKYIIDTQSGLRESGKFENIKLINQLSDIAKEHYSYMLPYVYFDDESSMIRFVTPFSLNDKSYKNGSVVINVNLVKLFNSTYQKLDIEGDLFICSTQSGKMLAGRGVFDAVSDSISKAVKDRNTDAKIQGEKVDLHTKKSAYYSGITYVFTSPYSNIAGERMQLMFGFMLASILLGIVEMFLSLGISKYIYQPFRHIFSNINMLLSEEKEVSDSQTSGELSLLNNYMQELQNDLERKNQTLESYMPIVRRNIGRMIIDGSLESEEEIHAALKQFEITFTSDNYIMCMFKVDNWEEIISEQPERELSGRKNAIFTVIEAEMLRCYNVISDIPRDDCMVFIIDAGKEDKKAVDDAFKQINDMLLLQMSVSVSMTQGTISELSEANDMYRELEQMSMARFNFGYRSNISEGYESMSAKEAYRVYTKEMREINAAVRSADLDKAEIAVDNLLNIVRKLSVENTKILLVRIFEQLKKEFPASEEISKLYDDIPRLMKYSVIEELKSRFDKAIAHLINELSNSEVMIEDNTAIKVKEYIDKNYQEDLSLSVLGEKFKISSAYLSTLFKNVHNIGVVDYINKVRINTAKNLLKNTDMQIKEVSENIGFTNYNSFARVFKKETGISAKDFRHKE